MALPHKLATVIAGSATLAWLAAPALGYYEESHVTGDEVRVTVDLGGSARIEHTLTWRLVAGQPRTLDLVGTEASAQPEATTTLEGDDGRAIPAAVAVVPGRGVRVTIGQPKALRRGQYRLKVAYAVNLVDEGELTREGTSYRLAWKAPVPSEGYETPRVVFSVPAALEAPTALIGGGGDRDHDEGMRDDGVTSTLRRDRERDEIELMRPHVGRGEDVVWAIRVDAKALDAERPALAPPPPPPRYDPAPGPAPFAYAVVGLLSLVFAAAIGWKERRFVAALTDPPARMGGLVRLRRWERAALGGASLFAGCSLQLAGAATAGAVGVVVAMACGVLRRPRTEPGARGPGRWLILRPDEAFMAEPSRALTRLGALLLGMLAVGCFVAAGQILALAQPEMALTLALDSLVLAPLLATGLASQRPRRARLSAHHAWLAEVFRRLQRVKPLRVSPWARVPTGASQPDEVRVLVVPREPLPGLAGIEVGVAWDDAASCDVAAPEVLVRVEEATAASVRMLMLAPDVVPVPGRKPEERVYRLVPAVPTRRATAALAVGLGRELTDRRRADALWARAERRVPPEDRAASMGACVGASMPVG
jgi:hypothetical protein